MGLSSTIDFRHILLEHYKKMGISEEELVVLLLIEHLTRMGNSFITADLIALKSNYKTSQIDKILVTLVKKGYLVYEVVDKTTRTSLEPLKKKLFALFQKEVAKEGQNLRSAERAEMLTRLYAYFEKRLNRTLAPLESELINTWIDDAYSEDDIKFALEEGIAKNKKTMKSIDRILRQGRRASDFSKEGYSGVSDTWDKDIDETIEMAKALFNDEQGS